MKKHGFSWKRALGVTKVKRKISKASGIPLTKQGRKNKGRRLATKGCFTMVIQAALIVCVPLAIFAHPGRTDANGGHNVNTEGWGYPVGTYHFHSKYDTIIPVNKETLKPLQITVIVNEENVEFDQPPEMINGRTLVPIRNVVEKMGCKVQWDPETQSVYINTPDVRLEKSSLITENINVYVNNELVIFDDQPPVNINGRTLIPVRFVTEKLGYGVDWDSQLQIVYIE